MMRSQRLVRMIRRLREMLKRRHSPEVSEQLLVWAAELGMQPARSGQALRKRPQTIH